MGIGPILLGGLNWLLYAIGWIVGQVSTTLFDWLSGPAVDLLGEYLQKLMDYLFQSMDGDTVPTMHDFLQGPIPKGGFAVFRLCDRFLPIHVAVQMMVILACLRYWAIGMRVVLRVWHEIPSLYGFSGGRQ